jgi:hypothetical protein
MLEGNITTKAKRANFVGVLIRPNWIGKGKKDGQDARMNYGERIAGTIPDPIMYSVLKR